MNSLRNDDLVFDPVRPEPHLGVGERSSVLGFEANTNRNALVELITGEWHPTP